MSTIDWDEEAVATAEDSSDTIIPPPIPDTQAMLYGIVGEVARTAAEGREVHPVAVATACLSWLSAEIGPDIYLPVGDVWHRANLYTLHIGRSARGGKGEAMALVRRLRRYIDQHNEGLLGQIHSGGLSSREGLAGAVHNGFKLGKEEVPAVEDKRLWIVEAEFVNLLAQGKREGNTLLPALREVWDGGSIEPLTKGRGMWSTKPHIALHGNITPYELAARLEAREINGGTLNRILPIWAERTGFVAFPATTDIGVIRDLGDRIATALWWAKGDYPKDRETRRASLSPRAKMLYEGLYPELRTPHPAGELIAAATERRAPMCLRIALIHAIMEKTLTIQPEHIRVAHAWVTYGAATAAYVLAGMGGAGRNHEDEKKLVEFLQKRPRKEATRRAITHDCFHGHKSGKDLDRILGPLVEDGTLTRREEEPRAGGRKRIVYALTRANNANYANNEQRRGSADCEQRANNANYETGEGQSSQSSQKVRTAETPANTESSQSSQTSPTANRYTGPI